MTLREDLIVIRDAEEFPYELIEEEGIVGRTPVSMIVKYLQRRLKTEPTQKAIEVSLKVINDVLNKYVTNANTFQNTATRVRKVLKDRFGADNYLYRRSCTIIHLPPEKQKALEEKARSVIEKRNKDVVSIQLSDVRDLLEKLSPQGGTQGGPHVYDTILFLMLISGSRAIEILSSTSFEEVKGETHWVRAVGIAKDKLGRTPVRPLLRLTAKEFIYSLGKLRECIRDRITGRTNEEISRNFTHLLSERLRSYEVHGLTRTHDLRRVYANTAYELYADKSKVTRNRFIQEVLGHAFLETSLAYNSVRVEMDDADFISKMPVGVSADLPKENEQKCETKARLRRKRKEETLEEYLERAYAFFRDIQVREKLTNKEMNTDFLKSFGMSSTNAVILKKLFPKEKGVSGK